MKHELEVWLSADHVGRLYLVNGRLSFQYHALWLSSPAALPLSVSLPLRSEPFDDHQARPFFAGLLPEGQMRRLIAQQFQISGQNDFAMLDHIGGECAGAVTFIASGQTLTPVHDGDVQWLSEAEFTAIVDELPRRPMLAGNQGLRLSLAGAQVKLPVVFDGERFGLPRYGTPSSHIIKLPIHGINDSVINEGFCLKLAEALQLATVKSRICTVNDHSFLLVQRYDRVSDDNARLKRLHQEDFCQALSVVPELKYQNEGGPNLAQCFELVRRVTKPNAPQVLRLLDYVIFNALIGNHDAHAKNFSLLYASKWPELAPLYDALSTAVYPTLTNKMAMKLGSKYVFNVVQSHHWMEFAKSAGLAEAQTRKRILILAKALPALARQLQADPAHPFVGNALVEQITMLIEQRCALTLRQFSETRNDDLD